MEDQKKKFSSDDVETWRQALKKVGGIKGWEPQNYSGDGELIQAIVEAIVIKEGAQVKALQFLQIRPWRDRCLSELRWIDLRHTYGTDDEAEQRLEATDLLHLQNAVVVNLSALHFTDDVFKSLIMRARKLKVLTITHNGLIRGTPILPKDSVLEKLTIYGNSLFSKIDRSIGNLRCLTDLRVESCCELRKLLEQIGELRSLRHLSLNFCSGLIELPDSVSKLESLTELNVSGTEITRLPDSIGRLANLSYVDVSHTPIEELPSTMSKLRQLRALRLSNCNNIQELPKLSISLTALLLTSTSLPTVPNLSYLTNLVELVLSDRFDPSVFSDRFVLTSRFDIIQTSDLRWIGKLFKLSKLRLCFPNVRAPTVEWGSLSQLIELTLTLYGLYLPTSKQFSSNLIVLKLYDTRRKQVHLDRLPPSEKETVSSSSRKSRENKANEQHHVQLLDIVGSSERSRI
ncbi:hypothetical protein NL676_006462 [Syzygium grande]|nr:hypothetical protein NL676_006462 [Syzygium grande]